MLLRHSIAEFLERLTDKDSRCSHVGPPYPETHWHQILPPSSSHVAPFLHGCRSQDGGASAEQSLTDELSMASLIRSTGRPLIINWQ